MLSNWAVRAGHLPVFVDLDVSQNSISLPGTISALVVERTALVEEGFNIDAQIVCSLTLQTLNKSNNVVSSFFDLLLSLHSSAAFNVEHTKNNNRMFLFLLFDCNT